MLIAVASASPAGSITLEGFRGGQPVSIEVHFAAIAELRAAVSGGHEVASGLIGGALSEDRIAIEHCFANGVPIGLFRTQPAGWPAVTEPDLKRIQAAMPRATSAVLLVVRTLAQRPWSATLFIVDPKRASTTEAALVEFPFDEYLLRNGWLTDLTPPAAPPPPRRAVAAKPRWRRRWLVAALASVAAVGGVAAAYEISRSRPAAVADIPELTPVVTPPIGLQASRSLDELELSWNRNSDLVRAATGGTLVIHNGSVVRMVPVSPAQLREGRVMYRPVPGVDIDFRLELVMPDRRVEAESIGVLGFDTAPSLTLPVAAPRPKPTPVQAADRIDAAKFARTPSQSRTEPQPLRRVNPMLSREVTEEMRNAKGEVLISVLVSIDAAGKVDSAKIVGANGEPKPSGEHLRLAALNAARQWRFRPATSGGRAVPSTLTLAFRF
jgi:TonB family protein